MTNKTHDTREGWLKAGVAALDKEFFANNGYELPEKLAVSCGFPRGVAKAIGQCWDPKVAEDGTTHMFVCPSQANPVEVLQIVLHEMIHASVGIKAGHKGPFRKLAKEFGMAGKMTATYAEEGGELFKKLEVIAGRLGKYPHAPMIKEKKSTKPNKWVRFVSEVEPKFTGVFNIDHVLEFGQPVDPWGKVMEPKKFTMDELREEWG